MSVGCFFIVVFILLMIAINISHLSKKKSSASGSRDPRMVGMDYMTAVQLPGIGASTTMQDLTG